MRRETIRVGDEVVYYSASIKNIGGVIEISAVRVCGVVTKKSMAVAEGYRCMHYLVFFGAGGELVPDNIWLKRWEIRRRKEYDK
jgi:hypothetical protein